MYFIYHIKGIKIGVSTNPKKRVENQGYTEYEILEEHTCIDTVSTRELELQKQYGYRVDTTPYKQSYEWCAKGAVNGGKIAGKKNKESGHMSRLGKSNCQAGGIAIGKINTEIRLKKYKEILCLIDKDVFYTMDAKIACKSVGYGKWNRFLNDNPYIKQIHKGTNGYNPSIYQKI